MATARGDAGLMSALEELAIDRKHVVGAVALALNVRGGVIPQLRTWIGRCAEAEK